MYGKIDRVGNVEILFNTQVEKLEAPGGKQYLPCSHCGKVLKVEMNVISAFCDDACANAPES